MFDELVTLGDIREAAQKLIPQGPWDFLETGAGDGITARRNGEAFSDISLLPRRLLDVRGFDCTTTVLGASVPTPVLIAPSGVQALAHPEAELATARAANATGTLLVLSMGASTDIDLVGGALTAPAWLQLYHTTRGADEVTVRRAERAGFRALCVTVDLPLPSPGKDADRRNRFETASLVSPANFNAPDSGLRHQVTPFTWDDLAWLRECTQLPIVLKGVLHPDDARRAADSGVAAIIVSNHGGRVLDGLPAAVECLPGVVEAVRGEIEVYVDGGIRRGIDVLKALALGARAVLVGRPIWWGLAVGGADGVVHVLETLRREFEHAASNCGFRSTREIDGSVLFRPSRDF